MSGELFPVESVAVKSPRLLWCERYSIIVEDRPRKTAEERFWAHVPGSGLTQGFGQTAEEACRDFGVNNGIRLWSEESAT